MIRCPFCNVSYVYNTLFCTECGYYLLEKEDRETDPLDTGKFGPRTHPKDEGENHFSSASTAELQAIRLKIGKGREIEILPDRVIHIGRIDPSLDVFPEVDLTTHTPAKSISRRHARIVTKDDTVYVEDLGSINGTYLNGRVLNAYLPEPLSDGDILQLGELLIEVEFQAQATL